jgi:heme exporter protein D
LFTLAVVNWVSYSLTLASLFYVDTHPVVNGWFSEFLSNGTLGFFTYHLSLLTLILVVPLSRSSFEEHSKQCVYQRVSHKFVDEIVNELNQTFSDE